MSDHRPLLGRLVIPAFSQESVSSSFLGASPSSRPHLAKPEHVRSVSRIVVQLEPTVRAIHARMGRGRIEDGGVRTEDYGLLILAIV